jgi:hypothetical protein
MADKNTTDKHNVTKQGDQFVATVTRYFNDMDRAVQWAESTYTVDTPEQAASDMSPSDAEVINSNINPAPIPAGAEQVMSGGGSDGTTEGAPTPQNSAEHLAVDNTAAGTHDPSLDTETTQVPTTDKPQASQPSNNTNEATTSK